MKKELIREVVEDVGKNEYGISAVEAVKNKKLKKKLCQCCLYLPCVSTSMLEAVTGFALYHFQHTIYIFKPILSFVYTADVLCLELAQAKKVI